MPRQRRRPGVVGPLILIFVGCVFLLQNTGYLPPNFWTNLWRLWPLILVLVGMELLLGHRVAWPLLAVMAACVLLVGVAVSAANLVGVDRSGGGQAVSRSADTPLGAATQASVTIRFGAGQLNVGAIDQPQAGTLASMQYEGPPGLAPEARYSVVGSVGQLEYQSNYRSGFGPPSIPFVDARPDSTSRLDVNFAPAAQITTFTVQTGAADAHIDLSSLHVSRLDMSIGAATAWIRFPQSAGTTSAHIAGGASTINLEIPLGVGAQIQHRGGLSTLNIDQSRFSQISDGLYRTADYEAAANKVDVSLETGVATIQVN